jgi:hypothetical protein
MTKRLIGLALLLMPFTAQAAEPALSLSGLVAHPLHLTLADLRALPPTHVSATQISGHGPVALDCAGPSISSLLAKATLSVGSAKNAYLAHTLVVAADDKYTVALSLGELDADYGNAGAIIATDCGGKPEDSPRLVMPNDKHGGRAVRGVVSMDVK